MYILDNISYSNFKTLILNNIIILLNKIIYNSKNFKFFKKLFNITYYPSLVQFSSSKLNNISNNIYKPINNLLSIYIPIKLNFITLNKQIKFLFNILNIPKISSTSYLTIKGINRISLPSFNSLFKYYTNKKNLITFFYNKTYSIKINSTKFITINLDLIKGINYNFNFLYLYNFKFNKKNKKKINKNYNNIFNLELFKIFTNTITYLTYNYNTINYDSLCYKFILNYSDYILKSISYYKHILLLKNNKILKYNKHSSISEIILKENILTHPLFQIIDQTNCLCELIYQYKIHMSHETIYNKFSIIRNIRLIKGDYITKLSPLSTNEGESAGIISSLIYLNSLHNKKLRTILNKSNKLFNTVKFDSTSLTFNKNYLIHNYNNLKKYYNININNFNEFGEFKISNNINNNKLYSTLSEILSISESIIPFILNNDPCRGLMGSKMHCQALPLIYPDIPNIFTKNNKINKITKTNCIISYSSGIVINVNKYKIIIQDIHNRIITYYINPIKINNYNHSYLNHILVWPGDKVTYGKILVTNKNYINLELSLGKNILIGYCNYFGNDHEDAIILKKNLLYNDCMLSIKFDIYETFILNYNNYSEFINTKLNNYNKLLLENNIIIPKIKLIFNNYNNNIKLLPNIIFNNHIPIIYKFIKITKGNSSRIIKIESIIKDTFNINNNKNYNIKINIITINFNKLNVGDKLCGRHGNKGVISCILDDINIPYTSFDLIPDILINPISSISRMNIGQILEGSCGFYTFLNKSRLNVPYFINTSKFINNFISSFNSLYKYKLLLFINSHKISKIFVKNPLLGSSYYNNIVIYYSYFLRLSHIIKNKIQLRSIGKYNEITQQPDNNKTINKGQRFGEMEFWALEAHGSSFNLKELLYIKSNKSKYNNKLMISDSFNSLCLELNSLNLNIIKNNNDIIF